MRNFRLDDVGEYTNGSRIYDRATRAAGKKREYLGDMETVMDGDYWGVALAWEE